MPEAADYRRAVDELLESWNALSTVAVVARQQRVSRLVYGWVAHVHDLAAVVRDLLDDNKGHASLYLTRAMIEHTVVAHWLRLAGDKGVDAILSLHRQSAQTLRSDARGGRFELPQELLDELWETDLEAAPAEETIARRFNKVCADLGVTTSLYAGYRAASQFLHPSFLVAQVYATDDGSAFLTGSRLNDRDGDIAMAAHCLIWSGRTLDEICPGKPRKKFLREIAKRIDCPQMLPVRGTTVAP